MQKHKKINLEFVNEEFSFDEEKKTTKCTLTFKPHFKEFAEFYGRPSDDVLSQSPKKFARLIDVFNNDEFTVSGVAVCAKDDVFDRELGVKIAQHRARMRAEKKYNSWLNLYFDFWFEIYYSFAKSMRLSQMALVEYLKKEKEIRN